MSLTLKRYVSGPRASYTLQTTGGEATTQKVGTYTTHDQGWDSGLRRLLHPSFLDDDGPFIQTETVGAPYNKWVYRVRVGQTPPVSFRDLRSDV